VLASLLVAAVLVGLESGVAASTGSSSAPLSSSTMPDDVVESKLSSTRRRAARRENVCSTNRYSDAQPRSIAAAKRQLVQWLRHAPPPWRGPPVLLI
jgi:hypothetical protein